MVQSEKELFELIKQGDENAFAQYSEQKRHQLTTYIQRNLGISLRKKVEPEDIFQETVVNCISALSDVDLNDRDPFSWMCQMAQRRIIDAHRKFFGTQKRSAGKEVGLGDSGGETGQGGIVNMIVASITSPSAAFSRNHKELQLAEAISQLPDDAQAILRMRYVEGRPTKEIADELGKTDAAVRVMLTRSVKKLQELLGTQ